MAKRAVILQQTEGPDALYINGVLKTTGYFVDNQSLLTALALVKTYKLSLDDLVITKLTPTDEAYVKRTNEFPKMLSEFSVGYGGWKQQHYVISILFMDYIFGASTNFYGDIGLDKQFGATSDSNSDFTTCSSFMNKDELMNIVEMFEKTNATHLGIEEGEDHFTITYFQITNAT